jgi:hypothetical protein
MISVPHAKTATSDAVVQVKAVGAGAAPASGGPSGGQALSHLTVRQLTVQGAIQLGNVALNPFTLQNTFTRVRTSESSIGTLQDDVRALRAQIASLELGGGGDLQLLQAAIKGVQDSVLLLQTQVDELQGGGGTPDTGFLLGKIAALEAMVRSAQVTATENQLFLEANFEQPPPLYTGSFE